LNTCFHLSGKTTNLLIDCGATSLVGLKQQQVDVNAVQAILVSHFHGDHFGGIPFFVLHAQFFAKRTSPLIIAGPPGLKSWFERAMEITFPGALAAKRKFSVEFLELKPSEAAEIAGATVTGFANKHGVIGFAYRIVAEGKVIAYSGDTEWTDSLIDAGHKADIFIAEAYFHDKQVPFHLDYETLVAHLPAIDPKQVVLTHMNENMLAMADTVPYDAAYDGLVVAV